MNDVYKSVRSQIEKGFLTVSFIVGNIHFKLRNPDYDDLEWMDEVSPYLRTDKEIALVSKCLLSINGRVLDNPYDCMEILKGLSTVLFKRLSIYTLFLIEESKKAYEYLEAFCYEQESRDLWQIWKSNQYFGYKPVENINKLSTIQSSWVIWNRNEDERIKSRETWNQVLFSASAFNSNVNKIKNKWDQSDLDEEASRKEVMDNAKKGTPKKKVQKKTQNGLAHKNENDLREEFRKWCAGEEDEHDKIVREYKETIKRKIREQEQRQEDMRRLSMQRQRELQDVSHPIIGFTDEQISKMKKKKSYVEMTDDGLLRDHISSKYLFSKEDLGNLKLDEQNRVQSNKSSIMDTITNRMPKID